VATARPIDRTTAPVLPGAGPRALPAGADRLGLGAEGAALGIAVCAACGGPLPPASTVVARKARPVLSS